MEIYGVIRQMDFYISIPKQKLLQNIIVMSRSLIPSRAIQVVWINRAHSGQVQPTRGCSRQTGKDQDLHYIKTRRIIIMPVEQYPILQNQKMGLYGWLLLTDFTS